ncbi:GNAT family N-acetyltransferase [Alsobacter soli]|uniref:GNAT family N-acetyltransferase n=1 Tax=Alsobacter soli TaxID=2109933 RepID=UPI0011B22651|nr:GNAT family N-acetyltransferase [Alsobacter soli]
MGQAHAPAGAIRPLTPKDVTLFRDHLLRLDDQVRRNRFAMGVSDAFLERYAGQAFSNGAVLLGYVQGGCLRAAAELRPLGRHEAEAAFSTEGDFLGRGIGTALFARLLAEARGLKLRRLYMNCLAQNRAMQALARKFSAELTFEADGVLGILDAAVPSSSQAPPVGPGGVGPFTTAILQLPARWRELLPWR